jgi:hypothetical protein
MSVLQQFNNIDLGTIKTIAAINEVINLDI